MSATFKSLGIEKLTIEERIALVEELWDSIAEATPLTDAQRAELDRRLEENLTAQLCGTRTGNPAEAEQIVVLAVFHARRDPVVWQLRA